MASVQRSSPASSAPRSAGDAEQLAREKHERAEAREHEALLRLLEIRHINMLCGKQLQDWIDLSDSSDDEGMEDEFEDADDGEDEDEDEDRAAGAVTQHNIPTGAPHAHSHAPSIHARDSNPHPDTTAPAGISPRAAADALGDDCLHIEVALHLALEKLWELDAASYARCASMPTRPLQQAPPQQPPTRAPPGRPTRRIMYISQDAYVADAGLREQMLGAVHGLVRDAMEGVRALRCFVCPIVLADPSDTL